MAEKIDKELEAMKTAYEALVGLPSAAQGEILDWLQKKLNISIQPKGDEPSEAEVGAAKSKNTLSLKRQQNPKDFLTEKRPITGVERIACLAYYLSKYRGVAEFKTVELTNLNKEAAQPNFTNAAVDVRNATTQNQYLAIAGGGKKQISARGEAVVEALPDREAVKAVVAAIPRAGRPRRSKKGNGKEKSTK
jgi:hypothetical protein